MLEITEEDRKKGVRDYTTGHESPPFMKGRYRGSFLEQVEQPVVKEDDGRSKATVVPKQG